MDILDFVKNKNIIFLFPHPDDECYSSAAIIHRLLLNHQNISALFLTHGAPKKTMYTYPLSESYTYTDYRTQYKYELKQSMSNLGFPDNKWSCLNNCSSTIIFNLKETLRKVLKIINEQRINVIFTCPYEGAHIDHDVCSFIASKVKQKYKNIIVIEYTGYFLKRNRFTSGKFLKPSFKKEFSFRLKKSDLGLKKLVCDLYKSQSFMLKNFSLNSEKFRIQPNYNYLKRLTKEVYYESWQKDISPKIFLKFITKLNTIDLNEL